jgi:predicted nucleotidyltransferase
MIEGGIEQEIQEKLSEIERVRQVRILYACESGSRAWGVASSDSDYDVRFVYVHERDWYLSIDEKRDVIELPVNEILDIGGWELRKAMQLMRKSNSVIYEWLQSPKVYRADERFTQMMRDLMPEYFNLRAGVHHYFSMARNTFEQDLQSERVRIKRYFYALRPLFAAMWVIDKQSVMPMRFDVLRTLVTDETVQNTIDELLVLKQSLDEKAVIAPVTLLNDFIRRELARCAEAVKTLSFQESSSTHLNELFLKVLNDG